MLQQFQFFISANILKNKGFDFIWYFVGDGDERKKVESLRDAYKKAIDKEMNKNYPMEEIEIAIKKTTNKSIRNMIICMALMLILCII